MTQTCQVRLQRLQAIVRVYGEKRAALQQVRAMREWVIGLEHLFAGSWACTPEEITNAEVARR